MVFEVVNSDPFQVADLRSQLRDAELLRERRAVIVAARLHTNAPFAEIGRAMNRDHSSITRSLKEGLELYRTDDEFVELCDRLARRSMPARLWRGDVGDQYRPPQLRSPEALARGAEVRIEIARMVFEVMGDDPALVAQLRGQDGDAQFERERMAVVVTARLRTNATFGEIGRVLCRDVSTMERTIEAGLSLYRSDDEFERLSQRLAFRAVFRGRWRSSSHQHQRRATAHATRCRRRRRRRVRVQSAVRPGC